MEGTFTDRREAGRALGAGLTRYRGQQDLLVLGLARGGVPVAHEVASTLDAELDVLLVGRIHTPQQPEHTIGALAPGGIRILNPEVIQTLRLDAATIDQATEDSRRALAAREQRYRALRQEAAVENRFVIVVDDGVVTGASLRAALLAVRRLRPAAMLAAVPLASSAVCRRLARLVDDFVVLHTTEQSVPVSRIYRRHDPASDEQLERLLGNPVAGRQPS